MTDIEGYARYAIYYAPEAGSPLWRFGSAWLGWDAETGEVPPRPPVTGLPRAAEELTVSPRRYGFHGTLKPPFALAAGTDAAGLLAAAEAMAAGLVPFEAPALTLHAIGRFASLRLSAPSPEMAALAMTCVEALDAFRAPPSEAELARRRANPLSEEHEALLARWGYPYVGAQFRFHLTLSSALSPEDLAATSAALAPHVAPFCAGPLPVREAALYGDPGGGAPFRLLRRLPFGGR